MSGRARWLALISLAVLVVVAGARAVLPPAPPTLVIFAGSAGKPPLDELAQSFQSANNVKVEITYGGSGTVLSQMILARTGDLYIPGSQDFMDTAEAKGAVDPSTRKIVAYLVPAIGVAKGNPKNIRTLADLGRPGIRVGIGNPETVCLGIFAEEILKQALLWDQTQPNIVVQAKSCDDAATILALGQVDAVIGWDVFGNWQPDKITVVPIPPEQVVKIGNIPVAVTKYVGNRDLADRFISHITGPEGQRVFSKNGYLVSPPGR